MDALKFIQELQRMCKSYYHEEKGYCSEACPAKNLDGLCRITPGNYIKQFSSILKVVEEWSAAHPVTTRADLFKKEYPNAPTDTDGLPSLCPKFIDKEFNCPFNAYCEMCRKEFWLQEVQNGRC